MKTRRSVVKTWVDTWEAPPKKLREAFLLAYSEAQCLAWGRRTSAALVLRQATLWLGRIYNARDVEQLPYSKRRLAWLASLVSQLEDIVEGAQSLPSLDARDAMTKEAEQARSRLRRVAEVLVGGEATRVKQLAAVRTSSRDGRSVAQSARALVKVLRVWRGDELFAAVADDAGLTEEKLDALEDLAARLADESLRVTRWHDRGGDAPATNVLEGRVLRELRGLQLAVVAAREERLRFPVMHVLPGLSAFLAPQRGRRKRAREAKSSGKAS